MSEVEAKGEKRGMNWLAKRECTSSEWYVQRAKEGTKGVLRILTTPATMDQVVRKKKREGEGKRDKKEEREPTTTRRAAKAHTK